MVGRTPWSARDGLVPLSGQRYRQNAERQQADGASAADQGVRPGFAPPFLEGGFSTLLGWAFRPRNFMKNWHHCNGGSGKVVGTVEQSRPRLCLIWSMLRFCANNWASFVSLGSGDSHVPLPGNTFWHALRFAEGEARCH